MINIRKLESELWESADLLRQGSKLTSKQYCMPVLALLFLRYAYSRYKMVEAEILQNRPMRGGRVMPVELSDFAAKSALYLPKEAQFDYLVNLPDNIIDAHLKNKDGHDINSLGEAVNNAMQLVEDQSEQLTGVLLKTYTMFSDDLLRELLRIFNNKTIDEVGGDFVQTGDFVNAAGMNANTQMTFFGQEKVEYNAQLCLMNMAVHGLNGRIVSGDEANSFYHDAHNLAGKCDYVMASSATDSANKDRDIREKLVSTGDVDVMVCVGNNFFYTLSLPCSLWFFDRNKNADIRDKVLFIDARNYYTVVDRTLNEWTEWQLRNLQAIVHLYRGEKDKYQALIKEYWAAVQKHAEKHDSLAWHEKDMTFEKALGILDSEESLYKETIKKQQADLKSTKGRKEKEELKAVIAENESELELTLSAKAMVTEAVWLVSKFGEEGIYQDILGLCKVATIQEIEEKNYSLTPGAYVGVAEVEDDGVDFHERMNEIHVELAKLNQEANVLMDEILKEWEELK